MTGLTKTTLRLGCLLLAAWIPVEARFAAVSFFPDYLRLQYAGSQGFLSLGAGKDFLDMKIESQVDYGFAPAWVAGEDLHVVSQKTTVSPWSVRMGSSAVWFPASIGYSLHVALGREYHLILPDRFRDYYWPSALHARAFLGTKYFRTIRRPSFCTGLAAIFEAGALDSYWIAYFRNRTLGLGEVLSVACALQAYVSLAKPDKLSRD